MSRFTIPTNFFEIYSEIAEGVADDLGLGRPGSEDGFDYQIKVKIDGKEVNPLDVKIEIEYEVYDDKG